MLLQKEREQIVEYGKKMSADKLTSGTSGNISVYNAEEKLMAISPSGIGYFDTTAEDCVVMDLEGNVVEGTRKPSSEWALHTAMYLEKGCGAVVHAHSMFCTVFAVLNKPLVACHYVLADCGAAEVPCAPYRTYGSPELAQVAREYIGKSDAVLLANHGMLACGKDLHGAYGLACGIEWNAELQYRAMQVGTPAILSDEEMEHVLVKFQGYGQ